MREATTVRKLISLYRSEVSRLEAESAEVDNIGHLQAWFACKVAIADLYEELEVIQSESLKRTA